MTATILEGKTPAAEIRAAVAAKATALRQRHGIVPGLAVVLVGEDPASQVYVRNKGRQTVEAGMRSEEVRLPATATGEEVLAAVARLNADPGIHGILVQLPLPAQVDEAAVIRAIDPDKDVDGFHPVNVGRLALGQPGFVPCTPNGCMTLIRRALDDDLAGRRALVLGRSNIVGKPMAHLLLAASCTVTIAHSRTLDLAEECRRAEILVAAVGRPEMIRGDWIRPGAVVIDVGINRLPAPDGGKPRLVGDVAFAEAAEVAGAITPVPGGVGLMTVALLLSNTLEAACRSQGIDPASLD